MEKASEWLFSQYGLAGLVIVGLVTVAGILWSALKERDKEIKALNDQRGKEREQLAALMEKVVAAQNVSTDVQAKRNHVMDGLSDALKSTAAAQEHHSDRVDYQTDTLRKDLDRMIHVVDSFGESNRVITGLLRDARDGIVALTSQLQNVAVEVKAGNQIRANNG